MRYKGDLQYSLPTFYKRHAVEMYECLKPEPPHGSILYGLVGVMWVYRVICSACSGSLSEYGLKDAITGFPGLIPFIASAIAIGVMIRGYTGKGVTESILNPMIIYPPVGFVIVYFAFIIGRGPRWGFPVYALVYILGHVCFRQVSLINVFNETIRMPAESCGVYGSYTAYSVKDKLVAPQEQDALRAPLDQVKLIRLNSKDTVRVSDESFEYEDEYTTEFEFTQILSYLQWLDINTAESLKHLAGIQHCSSGEISVYAISMGSAQHHVGYILQYKPSPEEIAFGTNPECVSYGLMTLHSYLTHKEVLNESPSKLVDKFYIIRDGQWLEDLRCLESYPKEVPCPKSVFDGWRNKQ